MHDISALAGFIPALPFFFVAYRYHENGKEHQKARAHYDVGSPSNSAINAYCNYNKNQKYLCSLISLVVFVIGVQRFPLRIFPRMIKF